MQTIVPHLWFDDQAEEAARFYVDVFSNRAGAAGRGKSEILSVAHYPAENPSNKPAGSVMTVEFTLDGQRFLALNGGPMFTFSEAVSFLVQCETQEEIDELWDKLVEGGGEHGPCGWLKDRFGLSWQVAPSDMDTFFAGPDKQGVARAFEAMMQMGKIDIAELQSAYKGE